MANNKHETHGGRDAGPRTPYGPGQSREAAAQTPQHDHTPRQEEQFARDQQAARGTRAPAANPRAEAEAREAQAASSIGAQIILDYNSDAGLGARGGAAGTIEENQMARDVNLVALGLDPVSPSGPPPSPEVLRARRAAERQREAAARDAPTQDPKATRMSSLAAGIAPDLPPPDGGNGGSGGGATAPANTTVPAVTQSGTTLNCTTGEWSGEPTSYAYAWTIDGAAAGSDAATYEVQAGDVGKSATCVVTATNAAGSAAAPPSAGHVVT